MSESEKNLKNGSTATLTEADRRILQAVREVAYGSVEITIHNHRIVQVERREKIRLPHEAEDADRAR